jgi:hypothetical protein
VRKIILFLFISNFAFCQEKNNSIQSEIKQKAVNYLEKEFQQEYSYLYIFGGFLNKTYSCNIQMNKTIYDSLLTDPLNFSLNSMNTSKMDLKIDDKIDTFIFNRDDTLSALVIGSLNYQTIKKKTYFNNVLQIACNNIDAYSLTHCYFAIKNIEKSNVKIPDYFQKVLPKLKENILNEIVFCENENLDVWIEAICFLSFFDPTFDEGIFIEKVINLQQKDGGWKGYSYSEESNIHTTILALWLLLHYESAN